jgi:hypothetical protein
LFTTTENCLKAAGDRDEGQCVALGASPLSKESTVIVRRLATITASVAIALAGSAAVPSLASASAGHGLAKPAHGVAWTGNKPSGVAWTGVAWTGLKPTGVAWTGQKPTGVAWTGQKPTGVAWTAQRPAGVAWTR